MVHPIHVQKFMIAIIIVMTMLLVTGCNGCSFNSSVSSLASYDKAAVAAAQISYTYEGLYKSYVDIYKSASPELQKKMNDIIAPVLDAVKPAIKKLDDAVAKWKELQIKPEDYDSVLQAVTDLLSKATTLMLSVK